MAELAEVLAASRASVRGVLLRMVRDPALADDLTQEACLRAQRAISTMRGEAEPATWLTAIALNVARDHFRAAKRRPQAAELEEAEAIAGDDAPEHEVLQAEMSGCILGHIHRLPERQRDAVLMHNFAGLGHGEIASAMGVSEGNARVLLHRGLAALRASLGRECRLDFSDDIPCERR